MCQQHPCGQRRSHLPEAHIKAEGLRRAPRRPAAEPRGSHLLPGARDWLPAVGRGGCFHSKIFKHKISC